MFIGSLLAIAAIAWLSLHPGLTNSGLHTGPKALPEEKPIDAEKTPPVPGTEIESHQPPAPSEAVIEPPQPVVTQHKELETAGPRRTHTVLSGETLSGISQKYYGTASGWQKIYVANRNILSSPDRLKPGMRLVIPN